MNKAELIEFFQDNLLSGDTSDDTKRRFHPEVLAAALELALGQINSDKIVVGKKRGSFDPSGIDVLTRTVNCVAASCEDGTYGFDMPSPFQNLPDNLGIRLLTPVGSFNKFEPISISDAYEYAGLESFSTANFYSVSGTRITLYNSKPTKVRLVYIPKLRGLEDEDEVNFVSESGAEVFELAKQLIREQRMNLEDNTNQQTTDR